MKRILLTLISAFMVVMLGYSQNIPTIHNEDIECSARYYDGNNYQKDLLLYVDMLKATHPYYAYVKHQEQLDEQVDKMYDECGCITNDVDFKQYLAVIAAQLNDGHTTVPYWTTFTKIFPIKLIINGDASAIIEVSPEDKRELLGKEVKCINGKTIKQILELARPLVSAENDANYENNVKEFLMFAEFWSFLGMSNDVMHVNFTDGSSTEIQAIEKSQLKIVRLQKKNSNKVTAQRGVLFDYTIYEKEGICYMQFNQFADRVTHPQHTQLARFDEFMHDMIAEIKAKDIQTLVVDLQYNGGGNSQLGDVLLSWLYPHKNTKRYDVDVRMSDLLCTYYPYYHNFIVDGELLKMGELYDYMEFDHSKEYQIDYSAPQNPARHILNFDNEQIFNGNVIFIQGENSFSSSTLLLTLVRDNSIGIIIGEPSGGKPNHYGDVLYCILPNTGILATVSHKYFSRPNKAIDEESIIPDVEIELNNPDRDLVWEWIVENYSRSKK